MPNSSGLQEKPCLRFSLPPAESFTRKSWTSTWLFWVRLNLNSADILEPQRHREHRANSLRIKICSVELHLRGEIVFQASNFAPCASCRCGSIAFFRLKVILKARAKAPKRKANGMAILRP